MSRRGVELLNSSARHKTLVAVATTHKLTAGRLPFAVLSSHRMLPKSFPEVSQDGSCQLTDSARLNLFASQAQTLQCT